MKKETKNIGLIVGLAIIIFVGGLIILVTTYTIRNMSLSESEFSFTIWALVFFPSCAAIMLLITFKRNKKPKGDR